MLTLIGQVAEDLCLWVTMDDVLFKFVFLSRIIPLLFLRIVCLLIIMKLNLIVLVATLVGSTFALPHTQKIKQTPLGVPYQG